MTGESTMKRRPAVRPNARAGYTLVELLAVLSIMTVMLMLAYPSTAPVSVIAVDAGIKEVVQALRFAQADAMRTGTYRVVTVPTGGWSYSVSGPAAYGGAAADNPAPLGPGETRTLDIGLRRR
ncbi:MAG: hypothetical protein NVSMB6_17790 [Burkholderiaceae bacterium]